MIFTHTKTQFSDEMQAHVRAWKKLKNVIRRLENSHTRPHNDVKNLWWSFECSNDDDRYQCSFTLLSPILTRSIAKELLAKYPEPLKKLCL